MATDTPSRVAHEVVGELRNGQPAPVRFRQKPPQWEWVELKDEYAGCRVELLLNPGLGALSAIQTTSGIVQHFHEIIRDWNLDDPEGNPLPVSPAGVALLDDDLSTAIMRAWAEARELHKRPGGTRQRL